MIKYLYFLLLSFPVFAQSFSAQNINSDNPNYVCRELSNQFIGVNKKIAYTVIGITENYTQPIFCEIKIYSLPQNNLLNTHNISITINNE